MEKRLVNVRIHGVLLEIKPEWPVATVLADAKDPYDVVTLSRTETLLM